MVLKFKKHDDKYHKELEEKKRRAEEAHKMAVQNAKKCLVSDNFRKYRQQFFNAQDSTIELMFHIDAMTNDPMKYAFEMKDIVCRLRHLRTLLDDVMSDAGKAGEKNEQQEED